MASAWTSSNGSPCGSPVFFDNELEDACDDLTIDEIMKRDFGVDVFSEKYNVVYDNEDNVSSVSKKIKTEEDTNKHVLNLLGVMRMLAGGKFGQQFSSVDVTSKIKYVNTLPSDSKFHLRLKFSDDMKTIAVNNWNRWPIRIDGISEDNVILNIPTRLFMHRTPGNPSMVSKKAVRDYSYVWFKSKTGAWKQNEQQLEKIIFEMGSFCCGKQNSLHKCSYWCMKGCYPRMMKNVLQNKPVKKKYLRMNESKYVKIINDVFTKSYNEDLTDDQMKAKWLRKLAETVCDFDAAREDSIFPYFFKKRETYFKDMEPDMKALPDDKSFFNFNCYPLANDNMFIISNMHDGDAFNSFDRPNPNFVGRFYESLNKLSLFMYEFIETFYCEDDFNEQGCVLQQFCEYIGDFDHLPMSEEDSKYSCMPDFITNHLLDVQDYAQCEVNNLKKNDCYEYVLNDITFVDGFFAEGKSTYLEDKRNAAHLLLKEPDFLLYGRLNLESRPMLLDFFKPSKTNDNYKDWFITCLVVTTQLLRMTNFLLKFPFRYKEVFCERSIFSHSFFAMFSNINDFNVNDKRQAPFFLHNFAENLLSSYSDVLTLHKYYQREMLRLYEPKINLISDEQFFSVSYNYKILFLKHYISRDGYPGRNTNRNIPVDLNWYDNPNRAYERTLFKTPSSLYEYSVRIRAYYFITYFLPSVFASRYEFNAMEKPWFGKGIEAVENIYNQPETSFFPVHVACLIEGEQ